MRRLPKPIDDVKDVLVDCISNLENDELKKRIELCKDEIACATQEFEAKVEVNKVHTIKPKSTVAGIVTKDEMSKIYTDKMAKRKAPGRKYYDKYLASPKNGICPLCGQRIVSTLDHYLPKKKYPTLAVTPTNLIPACKDCNKDKGEKAFSDSTEEILHPYFDDIEDSIWLYAKITEEDEVAITFYVKKPDAWADIKYERVRNHFKLFKLNTLYSAHSAEELSNMMGIFSIVYKRTGSDGVRELLKELYESNEQTNLNSWKSAMYRALYESQWFCCDWISNSVKNSFV